MPLLFETSFDRLQGETMNELVNSTPITRVTPGSKARTLLQAVNKKLNRSYQEFDVNILRAFLPFAQGQFLDYLGDMLGVPRAGAQKASVASSDSNVKFYVEAGTFGDINSSSDITIPSGTLITTGANATGTKYRVTTTTILSASLAEQYVSVEALKDGSASNVGQNTLVYHNFTDYAAAEGLLVRNDALITSGSTLENDTNYRFRIANQVLTSERANATAIRLSALSVPGVSDIVVKPMSRGIGTYDIIVSTVVPNTPANVITAVQDAIARTQAQGIDGLAIRPHLTGLAFQFTVTWRKDTTTDERTTIRRQIQRNVQSYVNNLGIGDTFYFNEVVERVMATSPKIVTIGTANVPVDSIYIYKETKLQDNRIKEELLTDYTPISEERIIIEPSLETPVVVLDGN